MHNILHGGGLLGELNKLVIPTGVFTQFRKWVTNLNLLGEDFWPG